MPEHYPFQSRSEDSPESHQINKRVPSEEELRAFEEWREAREGTRPEVRIEEFARDPANPTQDEIDAVAELNQFRYSPFATFEAYFGYPDPRIPEPLDPTAPSPENDMREFDRLYEWWRNPLDMRLFAHDPEHPSEKELREWEKANAALRAREDPPSFEALFGYPDPRSGTDTTGEEANQHDE